jgi:hypothetical protein
MVLLVRRRSPSFVGDAKTAATGISRAAPEG